MTRSATTKTSRGEVAHYPSRAWSIAATDKQALGIQDYTNISKYERDVNEPNPYDRARACATCGDPGGVSD